VDDLRFGRLVRVLRHKRGWRQADLAARAGVSRTIVSDIEHGRASRTSIAVVRQATAPLELSVDLAARGRGADVDRVLDERHLRLLGAAARWLRGLGWATMAEVSYSEWGERGSIDLLAWNEPTATLLVIEIKTELVSVEATLRKHDEKVRLAPRIARDRFGWVARATARLIVFPDDRTERARIAAQAVVLEPAYPVRAYAARRWCRLPSGPFSGLLFLKADPDSRGRHLRGPRLRVQKPREARGR
jgi:transcriptional regulator with XRE-family HTH domain